MLDFYLSSWRLLLGRLQAALNTGGLLPVRSSDEDEDSGFSAAAAPHALVAADLVALGYAWPPQVC
jgi:hypothetical protein